MKRTSFLLAMLFATPAVAQMSGAPAANPGVGSSKFMWDMMTGNFTKAAEQIPEADYSYKPVATVRSIGELIGHVAGAQNMMCAAALGESPRAEDEVEKAAKTKAALVAALKASTAYCARAYAMTDATGAGSTKLFGQDMTRMQTLAMNATHNGEHYGNMVTYMRMKGMVPPSSQPAPPAASK